MSRGGLPGPGAILRPLDPALARAAHQVEVAVAVPVDHERVAVITVDLQGLAIGLDLFGLRRELAFALSLEEVERAGEVADDEIEVPVAVPVDRERAGADVLGHLPTVQGDDERFAVRALQDFRPTKCPVRLAVEDLEQSRHLLLHAGIRAGKDVATSVAVEVHKLWSRAGASPHAGHFGHLAFGLQPLGRRELAITEILVNVDLSAMELSDKKVLLAVAVDIGPARCRVTGAFDPDRHAPRHEAEGGWNSAEPPTASPPLTSIVEINVETWLAPQELRAEYGRTARCGSAASGHVSIPNLRLRAPRWRDHPLPSPTGMRRMLKCFRSQARSLIQE